MPPANRWHRPSPIICCRGRPKSGARIDHMETLSPHTEFGVKGIGEGGAIAPPAAIANAINDALRPLRAELLVSPITPRRVLEAIARAGRERDMKPVPFDYARPTDLLRQQRSAGARIRSSNSSPVANRSARCSICGWSSPISRRHHRDRRAQARRGNIRLVILGSCITHADIEDGRVPDVTNGAMRQWLPESPIGPCAIAAPSVAAGARRSVRRLDFGAGGARAPP